MEKKHNEYFEAILQLRDPSKELIEFVKAEIRKANKQNPNIFIAKEKKARGGIDLYISSQRYMRSLGNALKRSFSGEMKVSTTLHTRDSQRSKNLYRVTLLFRLIKVKKGDTISYKGRELEVTGVGKKVLAKDKNTGEKFNLTYKDLK